MSTPLIDIRQADDQTFKDNYELYKAVWLWRGWMRLESTKPNIKASGRRYLAAQRMTTREKKCKAIDPRLFHLMWEPYIVK